LTRLIGGLPAGLAASVFVVIHQPAWSRSQLPLILSRAGVLPALHAEPEQPFLHGRIYLAPPDYHLLVERDRIQLWRGPKENRHRPAINTLFRSAAVAHQGGVIGVLLTGALDDGVTGLWWIKKYGGLAVVQDPKEATIPDMPRNALEHVDVNYVCRLPEMGPLLAKLVLGMEPRGCADLPAKEPQWTVRNS
jgi:two-component system chemotaxis response regulator CheB